MDGDSIRIQCSDGLSDVLHDHEIASIVKHWKKSGSDDIDLLVTELWEKMVEEATKSPLFTFIDDRIKWDDVSLVVIQTSKGIIADKSTVPLEQTMSSLCQEITPTTTPTPISPSTPTPISPSRPTPTPTQTSPQTEIGPDGWTGPFKGFLWKDTPQEVTSNDTPTSTPTTDVTPSTPTRVEYLSREALERVEELGDVDPIIAAAYALGFLEGSKHEHR